MSGATDRNDADILDAYRADNGRKLSRSLIGANIIGIVGMPSGIVLDYFLYPKHFAQFVGIRFGVDALLLAIIGILLLQQKNPSRFWARFLGVLSLLIITSSFSLMIYLTDGERSPYFAGLIIVLMTFASMLPWTLVDTIVMCLGSLVVYSAACFATPDFSLPASLPLFGFNSSFIFITTLVCVGMTIYLSRVRLDDFRLRHQLDVQNRELQDLDRLKTQFFSNVSHELRTPLTLILGPVENLLARGESLDARVHEGLMLIQRNSLRLLKLINDLLDLTRLDQGAGALRRQRVAVGTFVKGIVDSVRHLALAKQLRMRVEEGDGQLEMTADPARLEKVLVNLLTNAVKYTPAGGSIAVRWKTREQAMLIEVEDTGVGIPPEDVGKVFDRFHQVRGNSANQIQGIGIGLALAKELVEQHGGVIEVESEVGRGSTFRIVLPTEVPSEEPVPALAAAQEGGEAGAQVEEPFEKAFRSADRVLRTHGEDLTGDLPTVGKTGEVVLVADDENDMRQFIVSLLSEDYRIVQTRHGGNVADLVAEHAPSLVLLDWMMPGKNGLEVCRELRANPAYRDLRIMLLTARIDEKSKIEALASGADDFLTKPFSSVEVKTRVANLLRTGRLQRDLRGRNTELTETIDKLQRTEMMLIQSEKMNAIGSLSAGLLHEINNPLNYTMTAISLVQRNRGTLGEDMQELVSDIEEGMVRVRDVITHLKNFAYPEKPDHLSVFPLSDALRDARKIAAGELDNITIEVDLPGQIVVKGQKTQLTHLFINLLNNASRVLKENANGKPGVIAISSSVREGLATIEVADNGPGIPPEILNRVFEPFFTTQQVGSGMGMGLSICHTIMESHGGSIQVRNRSEGGAAFFINIPLAEDAPKS